MERHCKSTFFLSAVLYGYQTLSRVSLVCICLLSISKLLQRNLEYPIWVKNKSLYSMNTKVKNICVRYQHPLTNEYITTSHCKILYTNYFILFYLNDINSIYNYTFLIHSFSLYLHSFLLTRYHDICIFTRLL